MKREYNKHNKSAKWKALDLKFRDLCEKAKHSYSKNIENDLKKSNPT